MEKELPKNWVKTDLGNLFNLVYGKGLSVGELLDEGFDVYGANGIIGKYDKFTFEKSKIIIACRGTCGLIHKTNPNSFITSNSIILDEVSNELINMDFVKYAMIELDKSEIITGTTIPQITIQLLKYLQFPLPPLAEQNRIVAKLDALFAQLETIKTSMAKVPLLLKDFRQQVLTQAVTGKLTEEWRKGKNLAEWDNHTLGEFADARLGKMLDNAKNKGELVSYLGNINVRWFEIDFSDLKQMKVEPNEIHKYELFKGDILVCEGGEPGRAAIWKYDRNDVIFQKALHRVRLNEKVLPEYFLYNLKVDSSKNKLSQLFTGTTIKHLTGKSFSTYEILVPSVKEQQEIVSRVESLFAKADAVEKQYETLKAKIERLPQAILHKAFKGELTQQLDSDGDARELLREIQELKEAGKTLKSKTNKTATKNVKSYSEQD